jgi:hypothetical protein
MEWDIKKPTMPFKKNDDGSTPKAKIVRRRREMVSLSNEHRSERREQHTTHNNQSEETGVDNNNNNSHDESSDSLFELDSSASSSSSNGEEDTDDENDIDKDLTSNYNVIVVNVDLLKSLVSRDLVCGVCHHRVEMVVSTIGLATNLRLKCSYCTKLQQPCCKRPAESLSHHGNSFAAYDINQMFVMGLQSNGLGYDGSDSLCGFLGLKKPWGKTGYQSLERRVGEHLMPLTRDIIMANLLEEIALSPRNPDGTVDLVASYDMGWQKRSSGNSYDSPSGHAFLVGS